MGGRRNETVGKTLDGERLDDGVPSSLQRANTLAEFLVFALALLVKRRGSENGCHGGLWCRQGEPCASAESSVLLLELGDADLKVAELCLLPIAGVLCSDSVTVCSGLFPFLRGDARSGCAWPFACGALGVGT